LMTEYGQVLRMSVADVRPIGRNAQGVRLIDIEEGDRVVSVARLAEKDGEGDIDGGDPPTETDPGTAPPGGDGSD